uniref:Uncharacterized protein LOC104245367 n=1 Tax=Nicotiana sylvestris TaxID=4096 RepID=A0A1U7Y820_NICSY|nr:PREDICTED: uncharacterized protein LOC104245367 [Nicotiana sylvestris]
MVASMSSCGDITEILANWIVNSGSPSHMVNRYNLLTNAKAIPDDIRGKVHLPTSSVAQIRHIGDLPPLDLPDKHVTISDCSKQIVLILLYLLLKLENQPEQVPRQWNKKLADALLQFGFSQSHLDYFFFSKTIKSELVVVLVYVDDPLVTRSCPNLILQTMNDLQLKFKMKDLGELKFFLGIEFSRSVKGIVMSQRKYALELIAEMGLSSAKLASTPLETNGKHTSTDYDKFVNGKSLSDIADKVLADVG